ncbi:dystrophin-related protein 2 [Caerostris darwini]|uniref:Dystrophin-related protein 2 n=1 Tax=Caerostris darwini TaxID=1538125 RepID=A0AAV4NK97_9ARAC|nr:dystrophin-related protein 2 [Caerostris darwini]
MISCFKGGASGMWENGINNAHAAVYTSVSDFNQDEVPKISKIIESLRDYDVFKYSAYRTAFKLRTIQKASKLHMVDLSVIHTILKDYECSANFLDETITPTKIENLMCALYTEASKKIGITGEPNIMALLFLAFLQNTFGENDKPLLFIHVKIALTLFSCAKLSEKYKYFFHFCSNGSTLSKQNLHVLLTSLSKIAEIVGEQVTFGSHLAPVAVKNLLKFSKGKITLKKFQKWLLMEPQTLVWISTLHRISTSETTQHFVSCDYCGVNPIIGLRYRCLQCISYNLCQNCFLCGRINKRHKERHQVQEFVLPASTWEETKATINTLKNKLPFAHCSSKPYLSFDEESIFESMRDVSKDPLRNSLMNLTLKKTTAAYIVKELSSIINKLESDKKNILGVIEDSDDKENDSNNGQHKIEILKNKKDLPNGDSLQSFKSNLDLQLERLKELLKTLQTPGSTKKELVKCISPVSHEPFNKMDHYYESTPFNSAMELNKKHITFSNSSKDATHSALEKQRNCSTSLEFTDVLNSCHSQHFTDTTCHSCSSVSRPSENQSSNLSLGVSQYLNVSSSINLSEKLAHLDASKLSPIYLNSSSGFDESLSRRTAECNSSTTPLRSSISIPCLKASSSTFTLNKDLSLEAMELELQTMLQQIENLLPQVSVLSNDSLEKEKVKNALSDMETAVKKLSHFSLTLSTGSTDL